MSKLRNYSSTAAEWIAPPKMNTRSRLLRLLARLDASPLPVSDPVRLDLEAEVLTRLLRLRAVEAARWGRLLGARQPLPTA